MTDTRTAAYQYHGAELGHHHAWLLHLLREAGFVDIRFWRVGRVPALAKSMIVMARKP